MQKLEITGGKKISGTITISGSKNATLPILASTILTNKKVIIKNIPIVRDVETMAKLLNTIGSVVKFDLTLDGFNHVDARIYDIQGREVAVLSDGIISSSYKTLSWTANDYASGIYFLKVIIDGQQTLFEIIVLLK